MKKMQYETKENDGILMNANESYRNVSKGMLDEIKASIDNLAFNRYPIDDSPNLREAYAKYIGVLPENLMVGNGSDEMLGLIISLNIKEGKKLYTLAPDFSMYDYFTAMANGEVVRYALDPEEAFDVEKFIEQGRRQDISMILFSNPNNPTGRALDEFDLLQIIKAFPRCCVVIDEAYADFNEQSMIPYINTCPNLIVLRTMSKAFGMAGIRCGFMISCASTMEQITTFKVPYNVNVLTQAVAKIALNHMDETQAFLKEVKENRDEFYQNYSLLKLKQIQLYPSKANYIYGKSTNKKAFLTALKNRQVAIRDYNDETTFRISIGTKAQNQLVLDAMQEVFVKENDYENSETSS